VGYEAQRIANFGWCGGGASVAWNSLLAPIKAIAADVKPVRIKTIENFTILIPATPTEVQAGVMSRVGVTRVVTESGVRGYSFGGSGGAGGCGGGLDGAMDYGAGRPAHRVWRLSLPPDADAGVAPRELPRTRLGQ